MAQTILVVDDSSSLRQVLRIALTGAAIRCSKPTTGKTAVKLLDGRKINLVVSDVNMPGMNGIDFLTELKKLPSYRFTPVIMLTTESGEDLKRKGQAAGAKAWVTKPFRAETLGGGGAEADPAMMTLTVDTRPDGSRVAAVSGVATIFTAADLQRDLAALVAQPAPCVLDLSAVEEFDSAGLQVALAFERCDGARIAWAAASEPVHRVRRGWHLDRDGAPGASAAAAGGQPAPVGA